jgi:hypothetical protein
MWMWNAIYDCEMCFVFIGKLHYSHYRSRQKLHEWYGWKPTQYYRGCIAIYPIFVRTPTKIFEFAFYHYLHIFNLVPHGNRPTSPYEMIWGHKPDISHLCVFSCDVFIHPPGRQPSKSDVHAIRGHSLGYTSMLKQIYYLEYNTSKIKVAANVWFDEGTSTVPLAQLPPYVL